MCSPPIWECGPLPTPFGRDIEATGQPTRIYEILKEIDNATYVRRVRVSE